MTADVGVVSTATGSALNGKIAPLPARPDPAVIDRRYS